MSHGVMDFSPLDHVLAPRYEILSEEEKQKILKKYRIKPYNLPKILASDPAVKALSAKVGDVLRITRKSDTAGESIYYRLVVVE